MTLRVDVVTIFPDYFSPLALSLIGKASDQGLVDIRIHDLRDVTTDRHRTVDDTPYGGGAGMVMMPEPWGQMLDSLLTPDSTLVVPTPAGQLFRQDTAVTLSHSGHLVFACGRYEGIDQRVVEYYRDKATVLELSIGDYVLNGGEVATLVMLEAAIRLVPGVVGNPESLVEESHQDSLVEYPSYTKPSQWRGLDVPEVLLGGNHAEIAKWRHAQAVERTAENRPDLLD
jgi:tRNA (guanine37-N1)-methyltransferase